MGLKSGAVMPIRRCEDRFRYGPDAIDATRESPQSTSADVLRALCNATAPTGDELARLPHASRHTWRRNDMATMTKDGRTSWIKPGSKFPDFELPDENGVMHRLSQLQGD